MIDGRLRVDPFTGTGWDLNLVRDAKAHFERARMVDPSNVVAEAFLSQVSLHTTLAMCTHGRFADHFFSAVAFSCLGRCNPRGIAIRRNPMTRK